MKVELTKTKVLEMNTLLGGILNEKIHPKLAFAVAKNQGKLESVIKAIKAGIKQIEKYEEYEEKHKDLVKEHSKKDDKGNPIVKGGSYTIESEYLFNEEAEELKEEYKDALDKYEEYMDDTESFKFHMVEWKYVDTKEDERIIGVYMKALQHFIEEEVVEKPKKKKKKLEDKDE